MYIYIPYSPLNHVSGYIQFVPSFFWWKLCLQSNQKTHSAPWWRRHVVRRQPLSSAEQGITLQLKLQEQIQAKSYQNKKKTPLWHAEGRQETSQQLKETLGETIPSNCQGSAEIFPHRFSAFDVSVERIKKKIWLIHDNRKWFDLDADWRLTTSPYKNLHFQPRSMPWPLFTAGQPEGHLVSAGFPSWERKKRRKNTRLDTNLASKVWLVI